MKELLTVFVISGMAVTACAQGVTAGFKAGANFANQTLSTSAFSFSADLIVDFHAGMYLTSMFNDKFGIQPELLYSVQGTKSSSSGTMVADKYGYLNIPVMLRINVVPRFNFHAGPQFGICLSAESTQGGTTVDFKDEVNTLDFSLGLGAGFDLPGGFNGGVRYNIGLSNLAKDAPSGVALKHTVFQIYLGIRAFGASR